MSTSPKAIIIGSGIAGLATAIRLRVQGFEVSVYEKNAAAGGKLHDLSLQGFHFDAGPSLFTQPGNIEELFELAGEPIEEYLHYHRLAVSCNYFYEDGSVIKAFGDKQLFAKEIAEKTNDTQQSLLSYLDKAANIYNSIGRIFLNFSLHKRKTFSRAPLLKAMSATRLPYLFRSLHQVNTGHFRDKRTVQLFNRYATYNGSNPYKAPGILSLIPHLEHNEGSFYPEGGMISIAHALYRLAVKKGVDFYFDTPVQRIIHNDRKVIGVVVNAQNITADVVVSNMDIYLTHKHLLNDDNRAKKILRQERSSSAMIFYWGIKKQFPELDLHNILFADNYQAEFEHLFGKKGIYHDPTIYINISSKQEPGIQAPAGEENWFVMINVPANKGQDWEAARNAARSAIISKINRLLKTDIEPLIAVEATADPATIEAATATYMGSLYGTSSNTKGAAFLRHPNFSREIEGLYFAGGSVHPGGGIPLCLKSAGIVAELVADARRKEPHAH